VCVFAVHFVTNKDHLHERHFKNDTEDHFASRITRAGQITGSHVIKLQITNYSHECNLNYQLQITLEFEAKLQITN